jgi:homopolymeric O-antigen transport system ATP-binding protein
MNDIAIRLDKIGKKYHIGRKQERYKMLRDTLTNAVTAPFRRAGKLLRGQATGAAELDEILWALRDISFEVKRGEIVGIIGHNGAGKSTLLKVLSRITEPTEGYADVYGRVGSLLEVGTGFHPELTGRENIYLNGAILGMKRVEIDAKFDEIVSFAEVERFMDTPVKHYSSGMRLRLGFAVAAHLEPEILLVDEVLAVGDASFQKKCLNKMQDVGQEGRTVLFVSHNMPAITRLCGRTILLDGGRVQEDGLSHKVVSTYLSSGLGTTAAREWSDLSRAPGDDVVRLSSVRIRTEDGRITEAADIRQPIGMEMEYEVLQPDHILMPYFWVLNQEGIRIFSAIEQEPEWRGRTRPAGRYKSTAWIPGNYLAEGMLFVGAAMRTPERRHRRFQERDAVAFQVVDSLDGNSARGDYTGPLLGVVRPMLKWETHYTLDGKASDQAHRH